MDYRPLRMGDTGPAVLEVQQMLNDLGYAMAPMDGNFDTSTLRAVIAFQNDKSLPVDGVVAVNTWTALRRRSGRHEAQGETQPKSEESASRQEPPPTAQQLVPLEETEPYMPKMPIAEHPRVRPMEPPPEPLPIEPRAVTVPIVPLIDWQAIHREPSSPARETMARIESPPPSEQPAADPPSQPRGWMRVNA